MLGDVPGVAAAAADAGRIDLLAQLLEQSCDVLAAELSALLQVLLSPPSSDAAAAGREQRHSAAKAAAEAAADAAQRAARQAAAAGPQQQQQQQEQRPPPTSGKPRRRRRKKGAADGGDGADSDSDAEDLTALYPAAAEPGAMNGGDAAHAVAGSPAAAAAAQQHQQQHAAAAQQQQALPQLPERPGARERAVAACCRGAVEGLDASQACLHPVVAACPRPAVLLEALRSLTAQQAVSLLAYLAAMLRNHARVVGGGAAGWSPPLALPAGAVLPPLGAVVAWASALVDANLIKLSLQPEVRLLGRLAWATGLGGWLGWLAWVAGLGDWLG